ncbi:hypothetical protein FA95DRAFT_1451456, partial [Auriscalpium vulgare]
LGMCKDDPEYQALVPGDIVAFKVFLDEQQVGDGKEKASWLWDDFGAPQANSATPVQEYCGEGAWLRTRTRSGRWHKEVLLLEEEMRCIIRYFLCLQEKWTQVAGQHSSDGDAGRGAYA